MTLREEFIRQAEKTFEPDLKSKEDETMTSFYLYEIKNSNGFFWVWKERSLSGSYTIAIQKVRKICEKILNRVWGNYPGVELMFEQDIKIVIDLLKETKNNFYDRYSEGELKKKDLESIHKILNCIESVEWYISEKKHKDLLEEVRKIPGLTDISERYLRHLINLAKKFGLVKEE